MPRGAVPNACVISVALWKRCSMAICSALRTAVSVAGLTDALTLRGGTNESGVAMRCVAVGGAWPVNEW